MAESRLVPCNLMAWPKHKDLMPDFKSMVYHLWATCQPITGCSLIDIGHFSSSLSITQPAVVDALKSFHQRDIVLMDFKTGEGFILDWYRFHKFDGFRKEMLKRELKLIQSATLHSKCIESIGLAGIDLNAQSKKKAA